MSDNRTVVLISGATGIIGKAIAKELAATPGYEVVLLAEVNDRPGDAQALIDVLAGQACTVNLIPWNPVDRIDGLARPIPERVDAFEHRLSAAGLNVTVRRQRGSDRDAACGQLRLHRAPTG